MTKHDDKTFIEKQKNRKKSGVRTRHHSPDARVTHESCVSLSLCCSPFHLHHSPHDTQLTLTPTNTFRVIHTHTHTQLSSLLLTWTIRFSGNCTTPRIQRPYVAAIKRSFLSASFSKPAPLARRCRTKRERESRGSKCTPQGEIRCELRCVS